MLAVRDFTRLCNNAKYKKIGQDLCLGELYDVHNEIKIYTKYWLDLLIYYSTLARLISYTMTLKINMKLSIMNCMYVQRPYF
jgi:hypothetical protein